MALANEDYYIIWRKTYHKSAEKAVWKAAGLPNSTQRNAVFDALEARLTSAYPLLRGDVLTALGLDTAHPQANAVAKAAIKAWLRSFGDRL